MRELSLHIMDVVENGINAGATLIRIAVVEDNRSNRLTISIVDNGRGIPEDALPRILDPFYTTRTTRRVGLGLSMFRETSRRCEGDLTIQSEVGKGTEVKAVFRLDHIDLPPLGDMAGTMVSLMAGNEGVDFVYSHSIDAAQFELDTRVLKEELDGVGVNHPKVLRYVAESIREFMTA